MLPVDPKPSGVDPGLSRVDPGLSGVDPVRSGSWAVRSGSWAGAPRIGWIQVLSIRGVVFRYESCSYAPF